MFKVYSVYYFLMKVVKENDLNKIILIGNLGKNVEMRTTTSGKHVANFSLAAKNRKEIYWATCVAWEKTAELCAEYLKTGSKVMVEGRMQQRQWDDKAGVKHYTDEVIVENVEFLDSKSKTDNPGFNDYKANTPVAEVSVEELPF